MAATLHISFRPIQEFLSQLATMDLSREILFLQGSMKWLTQLISVLPPMSRCIASISYGSPVRLPGWQSFAFPSEAAGSVVGGYWHFLFKGFTVPPTPPNAYTRQLTHIIDPTVTTRHAENILELPSLPSNTPLFQHCMLPTDQLPKSRPLVRVCCTSVYIRQGWVVRPLSAKELGRAFDVPSSMLTHFAAWPGINLPWLKSAPVKLLFHVGFCLLRGCHQKDEFDTRYSRNRATASLPICA
jgi:hypothetical protein